MAMFVHLTPEKSVDAIRRGGIKARLADESRPKGVFAMPVTADFYVSHQWLRELKRGGQRTICAVYFRIPDEERVYIGHYAAEPLETTAPSSVEESSFRSPSTSSQPPDSSRNNRWSTPSSTTWMEVDASP